MTALDDLIPEPRLCEVDAARVGMPAMQAFAVAHDFDLSRVPLARVVFWLRTLPERMHRNASTPPLRLQLRDIGRSETGFRVLVDAPDRLVVGAIGRFWEPDMTFAPLHDAGEFARFAEPGWGKLVWELRCEDDAPGARLVFELRLTATDDVSWRKLYRYYRLIAPFSRFLRRHSLALIARDLGSPEDIEASKPLVGDELVANPKVTLTDAITIEAPPAAVWPWLVQMGCRRAGWYSYDDVDNDGVLSATEIVPELQRIAVGDVLPATPSGTQGLTVLVANAPRALVLGVLADAETGRELPFGSAKPERFFEVSWAFVLEPLPGERTRLLVRARADFAPADLRAAWLARVRGVVHHFMEREQLRNLKLRAEGKAPHARDTFHDVGQGVLAAGLIVADLVTPFLRGMRSHWGMTRAEADQPHPGDDYVPEPRWQWTHAIDVAAPPELVWPWIAQLGQDKAGFYSYQFLENLAGCDIQNANRVHAQWQSPRPGDPLRLHPKAPPLTVAVVEPERVLIAHAGMDARTGRAPERGERSSGQVSVSWAFLLQPRTGGGTRVISRFRSASSDDLATRILYGSYFTESVGFVMDRGMLRGVKQRAEREAAQARAASFHA
jgi:hypothetical protein